MVAFVPVAPFLAERRLVRLPIESDPARNAPPTIDAAHLRDRPLGRAGAWLLANLQARFAASADTAGRNGAARED